MLKEVNILEHKDGVAVSKNGVRKCMPSKIQPTYFSTMSFAGLHRLWVIPRFLTPIAMQYGKGNGQRLAKIVAPYLLDRRHAITQKTNRV